MCTDRASSSAPTSCSGAAMIAIVLTVHRDLAGGRRVEAEDQAHRGRLAGAVGAEEPGHDAGLDGEREVVDRALVAVVLRQVASLDHAAHGTEATRGISERHLTTAPAGAQGPSATAGRFP